VAEWIPLGESKGMALTVSTHEEGIITVARTVEEPHPRDWTAPALPAGRRTQCACFLYPK